MFASLGRSGTCLIAGLLLTAGRLWGQPLKPGFDKAEYAEMIRIAADHYPEMTRHLPKPEAYRRVYLSKEVGLDNRWSLWMKGTDVALISLRGTTVKANSWLENFYAALTPATGSYTLPDGSVFRYALAQNPRAEVHMGWLLGIGCMSGEILTKLDSCYRQGARYVVVTGHSQGGALAYLLTAHLRGLQRAGAFPSDVTIKTYCSAGPKPGNLYFAYDYEVDVQMGWGYNVVNAADWVPQTPMSVQTLGDFAQTNPFTGMAGNLRKQKFPTNVAMTYAYNRIRRPPQKAVRRYQNYLGRYAGKAVKKQLPGYLAPAFGAGSDYVRVGPTIVLNPTPDYYARFADNDSLSKVFVHHFFEPYLYLLDRLGTPAR